MNNFIVDFDLFCISKVNLGFMGTILFIGLFLSSLIFPRLGDIHGRKPIFIKYFFIHVIGVLLITIAYNIYWIYIGLFLVGLGSSIRIAIGYVFVFEFFPKQY